MALRFNVIETTMTPLWDYGWFDVTRFRVEGPPDEWQDCSRVLRAFLQDPISQRSFCDPGGWGEEIQRHGPFVRESLLPDWFRQITADELGKRIQAVFEDPEFTEAPSRVQRQPVEEWIEMIMARGDTVFALEAPDQPEIRVFWHFVWSIYHEFACFSPDRDEFAIAVIGYD